MSPVSVIKAAINKIDTEADIAILDAPPGTSCPFIQTVAQTDYVILVTEPTPFGFSDLKQSVETLRIINKPFGVIINRADIGNNSVREYLRKENISLLMEIPFKKEIAGLYSRGKIVAATDISFRKQLQEIVENIATDGNSSN
jgi:MinD superfamily P-loop ATPase